MRLEKGSVDVLDDAGRPQLRTLPAYAVDAVGTKRALELTLDTTDGDAVLTAKLDTTGLVYPIVVDPTWVTGTGWPAEAVVALNSVWLKAHSTITSTVTGTVAVIDASPGPVLADSAEAVVGRNVTVNGTVSANRVRIKQGGAVNGDVRTNALVNNGSISGATVTPLALPLAITVPAFPAFNAGTTAVTLQHHEDLTLAAGSYGDVLLRAGTAADPTVLTLSGGVYRLRGLEIGHRSRVACAASCEIRIKHRLESGPHAYLGPATGSGLGAPDVQVFVEGVNGSSGNLGGAPKAAAIGFDNTVIARVLVPNGTLWLKWGTVATGVFVARDVSVGEGVQLTKDVTTPCIGPIDDGNPCTSDTCDQGTGQVHHDPLPSGASCANGDLCDGAEICDGAGSCQAGTPLPVDDGNPCTTDACDPTSGVSHTPVAAGTDCSDVNACNGAEICNAGGACQAGTPPNLDDGDACTADSCGPQTGVVHAPLTGTACDDGNVCTQTDTCQAGTCTGSNPVTCTASDQCHDAGTCNPAKGACTNPAKPNGSSCDDANGCTQTDTCQSGACTSSNPVVCTASDQCHTAGTCEPGTGTCSNPPKAEGASCNDGDACTQTDTCNAGSCTGGSPVACAALDQCHDAGTCAPATGTCSNPPKSEGASCNDGSACTVAETCTAGACGGGTPVAIDDGNPCTADSCSPLGGVIHTPVAAGTACDDADLCNGGETCGGAGSCEPGTPVAIDDDNVCTVDTCDPNTGVSHAPVAAGTGCADSTVCNGSGTCDATGTCQAGTPLAVDDGNVCTADACDPIGGVTHTPIANCDPIPSAPGVRFETRASLIGRVVRAGGAAVAGYTLAVYDAPATTTPRSDVVLTVAADGSFRARLSTFPDSAPPRTPAHKVVLRITGEGFAPITRVAYLYPGDAANLGEIVALDLDPQVTMIGPGGGVATDSQGLVELVFPPGAVSTTVPVQITPIPTREKFPFPLPDSTSTGYGVVLTPHTLELAVPVTMRFQNYRNIPTNLSIPLGDVDYANGTWDHSGFGAWDGERFRATITHFSTKDLNLGSVGQLVFRMTPGGDPQKSSAAACGASSLSYGSGSVRQTVRLPGTTRRGEEYALSLHYDSGLAGSRQVGAAPSAPFEAAGGPGIAVPIGGPTLETACVGPGSSAPPGFCASGGACQVGMSPMVNLGWSKYLAAQLVEKNKQTAQTVGGVGTGSYVNLPPGPNGKLPLPGHMVADFVALFAGTTGGGGTCAANGGGFGSGSSTGSAEWTTLEPGPQVRHRSYELAYHRRTSALGAGWGLEEARESFLTPAADQLDIVHGDGQRETFRARPEVAVVTAGIPFGNKAMARDRVTGELFYSSAGSTIARLAADGTSTPVFSSLGLPDTAASMAVARVSGQRYFALACQSGLAVVDPSGVVTTLLPRVGPFVPSPRVAAIGSVVFYTDASGSQIHKFDLADATPTDDPIGDANGQLSLDPKTAAGGVAFDRPEGLAVGSSSELYVACPQRHTVYVIDPDASTGLPSAASAVRRVMGTGGGAMIAPLGVSTPGPLFTMNQPFMLDVDDAGFLFAVTTYGVAKYDPLAQSARWFALSVGAELGVSFSANRSFVAGAANELIFLDNIGNRQILVSDAGLVSEFEPTRRASIGATSFTITDTTTDSVETYAFDDASRATGRLSEVRKRTGELVYALSWSPGAGLSLLAHLEDATGGKHQFSYDGQGKLQRITDPTGRQIQLSVNADGDLSSITLPSGEIHGFDYEQHRMVHKRDPRGEQSTYAYRSDGTVDTATRPGGGNLTMVAAIAQPDQWDANGRPIYQATYTDDRGVVHAVTLNAAGRIERDVFAADGQSYDVQNVYNQLLGVAPGISGDGTQRANDLYRVSHTTVNGLTVTPVVSYDVRGRLIQQDAPVNSLTTGQVGQTAGTTWIYSWGSDDRLAQVQPRLTNIFYPIERDAAGRMTRIHDEQVNFFGPTGRESLFTWRPDGQPQTTTEHGVTTTFGYDPTTANVTTTADTLGRNLALTYTPAGKVATVNDGTTTVAFGHDQDNRLTTITDALGHVTTMGYAHAGCACAYGDRVTSLHTPDLAPAQKWSFTYDPDGRLASVTDPLAKTEAYTYSAAGDLVAFQDRKNRTTTFTQDQLGRPATTQDPLARRGTFAYPVPVAGAWTGAAVFAGSPDSQAAPTVLTDSLRDGEYQIGLREHRAGGYPAQVEFYRDATFELSFGRSFDAYGRLSRREDRVGLPFASGSTFGTPSFFDHDMSYERNTPLPVVSLYGTSRPGGYQSTTFGNNANFDTTQSEGLFGPQPYTTETYTRDAAGRITAGSTTFQLGSHPHAPFGFISNSFTYDPSNQRQVTGYGNSANGQTLTYDSRGLVATRTVSFARWLPRPGLPPPAPPPDPPYETRIEQLGTFTYVHDAVGRNTLLTFPDGHRRVQVWDVLGRLTSRCYEYPTTAGSPGTAPTRCYAAQYDEVGNPTLLTDPERSCSITYDSLDRVTGVTCSDGQNETYAYNALGALSVHAGVAVDHQRARVSGGGTASAGLPATHAGQPVTLDAVGKVTSLQGMTLGWNRLGRLTSAAGGGTYGHDAFLRRVVDTNTPYGLAMYLYEGPNIVLQAHDSGDYNGWDLSFGYDGVDHPLWLYHCEHEALVWFELDTIGNVRRLRGAQRFFAGAISSPPPDPLPEPPLPLPTDLGGYKYTAFGRLLPPDAGTPTPTALGQALSQPMRWQGRWFEEETGLYDFRNRVWSPELGASLSPDEFGFFHTEGTLWSWPGQNPIRWRDPTGRFGDETIVLMHHPEPVPAGLPPGPPSGVFVGVGASATFTGAVSVGAGQFFGAATPDAAYRSVGIGVGILPAAGAGVQVGWFAGTAEEFNQAQSLFLGIGSGVGVEGALIFGPNGSFGASLAPQLVWGSPLWGGTILGGEGKVVCE